MVLSSLDYFQLPLPSVGYCALRNVRLFFFLLSCVAGTVAVLVFIVVQGAGHLQLSDGWMLAAVVTGAVGYTEGGRLTRNLGGGPVICWALLLAAPVLILPVGWDVIHHGIHGDFQAWFGLGYVSIFSMFIGFLLGIADWR